MKLPLLDYVNSKFNISLKDTLIIANQHILETNLTLFEYLCKKELNPKNVFLIGKCYSLNKKIFKDFVSQGFNIYESKFSSHKSYDEQFEKDTEKFLKEMKNKVNFSSYKKIIILDDGGYIISKANSIFKGPNIICIEQTSSGINKISKDKINLPIINVARSKAKLDHESPIIAEIVVKELKKKLLKLNLKPKRLLIIGKGPIGREIYNLLYKEYEIEIYDKEFSNKITSLKNYDLIIGATGNTIFEEKLLDFNKPLVLVSASSSDREFPSSNLRMRLPSYRNCHKDIKIKEIYLLNSGFPINFSGKKNSAAPKKIQLTRALIFSAICIASKENFENGIIDLDKRTQEELVKNFYN